MLVPRLGGISPRPAVVLPAGGGHQNRFEMTVGARHEPSPAAPGRVGNRKAGPGGGTFELWRQPRAQHGTWDMGHGTVPSYDNNNTALHWVGGWAAWLWLPLDPGDG